MMNRCLGSRAPNFTQIVKWHLIMAFRKFLQVCIAVFVVNTIAVDIKFKSRLSYKLSRIIGTSDLNQYKWLPYISIKLFAIIFLTGLFCGWKCSSSFYKSFTIFSRLLFCSEKFYHLYPKWYYNGTFNMKTNINKILVLSHKIKS